MARFFIGNESKRSTLMEHITSYGALQCPVPNNESRGGVIWTKPTQNDVQALIDIIDATDTSLGLRLGYDAKTISRYRGASNKPSSIPYLAYKELCLMALDSLDIVK